MTLKSKIQERATEHRKKEEDFAREQLEKKGIRILHNLKTIIHPIDFDKYEFKYDSPPEDVSVIIPEIDPHILFFDSEVIHNYYVRARWNCANCTYCSDGKTIFNISDLGEFLENIDEHKALCEIEKKERKWLFP